MQALKRCSVTSLGLALLLCLGTLGCESATRTDVTGTWTVTAESRQTFLPVSERSAAATITLESNGTFHASQLPGELLYEPPARQLVTGSGTWKLISSKGTQEIMLNFNAITAGQEGQPPYVPYSTALSVSKGLRGAVRLYYFQGGDADQGRRISFRK